MILVLDNYDSFTYNLVQYLQELGAELQVFRNDEIDAAAAARLAPERIVISPGPGNPGEAGASNEIIRNLGPYVPLLGVCLGHQCIAEVFGGQVVRADHLMHGKVSEIHHDGAGLFAGLPSPFTATCYHSLIVRETLPDSLMETACTAAGELMGLQHKSLLIHGVQFHPESILTPCGKQILKNFLSIRI